MPQAMVTGAYVSRPRLLALVGFRAAAHRSIRFSAKAPVRSLIRLSGLRGENLLFLVDAFECAIVHADVSVNGAAVSRVWAHGALNAKAQAFIGGGI